MIYFHTVSPRRSCPYSLMTKPGFLTSPHYHELPTTGYASRPRWWQRREEEITWFLSALFQLQSLSSSGQREGFSLSFRCFVVTAEALRVQFCDEYLTWARARRVKKRKELGFHPYPSSCRALLPSPLATKKVFLLDFFLPTPTVQFQDLGCPWI